MMDALQNCSMYTQQPHDPNSHISIGNTLSIWQPIDLSLSLSVSLFISRRLHACACTSMCVCESLRASMWRWHTWHCIGFTHYICRYESVLPSEKRYKLSSKPTAAMVFAVLHTVSLHLSLLLSLVLTLNTDAITKREALISSLFPWSRSACQGLIK